MFIKSIKRGALRLLEQQGYYARHRSEYGIDYLHDIERLAAMCRLPITTLFDVGANIGQTSTRFAQRFRNAHILAFEPNPSTYIELIQQTADSQLIECHNTALGDHVGKVILFCNTPMRDSLVYRDDPKGASVEVDCTTVDSFCRQNRVETIDVLKIDTEGSDLNVLHGAKSMLSLGKVRFIYTEFYHFHRNESARGTALIQVGELLCAFGFRLIATYTDFVNTEPQLFVCANALFFAP